MLIAQVRRTLRERALIPARSRVLCACSGGPDSAALLFVLAELADQLDFTLEAASVDHGLREGAQWDLEIAAQQAGQLGVTFHALRIQVAPGPDLQARARDERYRALAQLAETLEANRIAVGHTQDDQAETVLARLLRGAGVRGLGAIDPAREDGVVRPLIDCKRVDVHHLARARFAAIAQDPSNQDQRFERVRIRSHVLPALLREDAALIRHLADVADEARETNRLIEQLAAALLERATLDSERLRISVLAAEPGPLRRAALRAWLNDTCAKPLGRAEIRSLDQAVRSRRGEVWISAGQRVCVEGDELRLCLRAGSKG
jgi:tRNA(Ile)-lysidine synthase